MDLYLLYVSNECFIWTCEDARSLALEEGESGDVFTIGSKKEGESNIANSGIIIRRYRDLWCLRSGFDNASTAVSRFRFEGL